MNILYPDLKGKTIIITGGLGFLASQFAKAFEDNHSNVIILDNKPSNKKKKNSIAISQMKMSLNLLRK